MTGIEYRGRSRESRRQASRRPATDVIVPLALLMLGLGLYALGAFHYATGLKRASFFFGFLGFLLALQLVLGLLAAMITARIMSTSFGELWTTLLKLAGIIIFTGSLSLAIPYGGLLVAFIYLGLLMWLFGLEFGEAVVFCMVFTAIRFAVVLTFYHGFNQ